MEQLEEQTQKEIFQCQKKFKKPINFINYSDQDYNILNHVNLAEDTYYGSHFLTKRVDYPALLKREAQRVDNKWKEESLKIQERLRQHRSHITRNIQMVRGQQEGNSSGVRHKKNSLSSNMRMGGGGKRNEDKGMMSETLSLFGERKAIKKN